VSYSTVSKLTYVEHVETVKMSGTDLRDRVAKLLEMFPHVGLIYIEVNNGGDLLKDLFSTLPVKVKTTNATIKKEVRAGHALAEYQKGKVFHAKSMPSIESQMFAFPNVKNDDAVDAISTGVNYFAQVDQASGPKVKVSSGKYA
jgi:phage terminase large subunit-like protein